MKRNPDVLREVLLLAETVPAGEPLGSEQIETSAGNVRELADHVLLLKEADYLQATVILHSNRARPTILIYGLTHRGRNFVSVIKDKTVWKQVKKGIASDEEGWTLPGLVEIASEIIRQKDGLD